MSTMALERSGDLASDDRICAGRWSRRESEPVSQPPCALLLLRGHRGTRLARGSIQPRPDVLIGLDIPRSR
jgi:hypothetical protein